MSTPEPQWNVDTPPPKTSNRKLWWIIGCTAAAGLGFIVLCIAATILVPNVMHQRQRALDAKVQADLATLSMAVEEYRSKKGTYPSSWSDLVAAGKSMPRDPWDRGYVLLAGEDLQTRPRIFTYGRDGVPGGENEDADVEYTPP